MTRARLRPRPSTTSPTASGRRSSSSIRRPRRSTATTATPTASRTRGPEGRARARALMERTAAEATAIATDGLPTEDRITRDMLKVIAELQIEEDDQAPPPAPRRRPDGRPAAAPAAADPVPAGRHARAARGVHRPAPRLSGVHGRQRRRSCATASPRPDRAAHRRRADHRPDRADARDPDRVGDRAVDGQGRLRGGPRARPRRRPRRRLSRPTWPSSTRSGATTWRRRARTRASGRRPNGEQLYRTAIRSWTTLDLDPEEVHRIGLDELESIEAERREYRPRGRASATTRRPIARRSTPTRPTRPATKDELVARATEDIERAMAIAPRYFGVLPQARLRGPRGRGVQGEGRAVRLLLPAGARRLAAGDLLRQRLRPAEPQVHEAGHDDLSRGRARATTSRSRSRWRTRTSTRSAGSGRGWSVAPTSRAGACTASGWPTRWACSATRRERFGMLDAQAWRAARLVVDTGLHALRWPRQRSIDFLKAAGLSETDAVIETDRYICWPGQALTYKIGQREIERLRRRAVGARRLGVRPAGVPRRGAGPRLAAAGDAGARAPELAGDARSEVGYESKPIPSASSVRSRSPRRPSLRSARSSSWRTRLTATDRKRLGRERDRRRWHDPQPQAVLVGPQDEVADDAARPAARPDTQARCSRGRTSPGRPSSGRT